jgi:hypothetical protein
MTDPEKLAEAARRYRRLNQFEQAHFYETILIELGRCKRCGQLLTDLGSVEFICSACNSKPNPKEDQP